MVSDDDHAKLGDFGIARGASDPALTVTGEVTGSPAYLAPEVASGSPATPASDVWSLGATLHHAVVGRAPYDVGGNVMGGLYRIVHDDPPRLPADHPLAERAGAHDGQGRLPSAGRPSACATSCGGSRRAHRTRTAPRGWRPCPRRRHRSRSPHLLPRPPARSANRSRHVGAARGAGSPRWPSSHCSPGSRAWVLWPGDGARPEASDRATPQQTRDPQPSEEPSSEEPSSEEPSTSTTDEPTTDPSPPPGDTTAEVRAFLQDYFTLVTSDPEASFDMLTPEFQAGERWLRALLRVLGHDQLRASVRHHRRPGDADDDVHDRLRDDLGPRDHAAGAAAAPAGRRRLPHRRRGLTRARAPIEPVAAQRQDPVKVWLTSAECDGIVRSAHLASTP